MGCPPANYILDSVNIQSLWWKTMAWIERKYSKGQVDRAGEALITLGKDSPERENALTIVDHCCPVNSETAGYK